MVFLGFLWSCNFIVDSVPRHFDGQSDPPLDRDVTDPGPDDGAVDPDPAEDGPDLPADPVQEDMPADPDLFDIPDMDMDGGSYLLHVSRISAGGDHTCAVLEGSQLVCWGSNQYGQLGDGTMEDKDSPSEVTALSTGVVSVAAGSSHTCAVGNEGDVRCWGQGAYGKLGNGSDTSSLLPVPVTGLDDVSALALGQDHSCAFIASSLDIFCWGYNEYGQLGNNGTEDSSVPVSVQLAPGPSWIAAGFHHTCAVLNDQIGCWGHNEYGCLGDGTSVDRLRPAQVQDISLMDPLTVTAGYSFTCALFTDVGVKCWGCNADGQIGDGSNENRETPVSVLLLDEGVEQIDAGRSHACAVLRGGNVMCWGGNWEGQLGDGTTNARNQPVSVLGLPSGAAAVSAGMAHTCALMDSGMVFCWGINIQGQLGRGTISPRGLVPQPVAE
jgi:alpha-tubulin suppressor-like RCC1 family protein